MSINGISNFLYAVLVAFILKNPLFLQKIKPNMINITNECNMELMKRYEDNYFDLAIVDPPYGGNDAIGLKDNKKKGKQATKRTNYNIFKNVAPTPEYFTELKRVSKNQIIWGVNFYNNYDLSGGRLVWDKKGTAFGRAEMAYLSMTKSVNICEIIWNGMIQHDMKNKEIRQHPTQKPVKLYEWQLMNYANKGNGLIEDLNGLRNFRVLDTHLGSGSIALACHNLGFNLTACELDKEYYNAALKRLKEHQQQLTMF